MIWIDYIVISIIFFSTILSFIKGGFREILFLITWIYAFLLSKKYYIYLNIFFKNIENVMIRNIISFFILFIFIILLGNILYHILIFPLIKFFNLFILDKIFGFIFGIIRGFILISFFITFCKIYFNKESKYFPTYYFFQYTQEIIKWISKKFLYYLEFFYKFF